MVYLSITLLVVVMIADTSRRRSWIVFICPLLFLFVRLISATPNTIKIEPIICQIPAVSLKMTIPRTNDKTADKTFVTVTIDKSADFKIFKIINQLRASKNPFKAKIKINFEGILIPSGIQIRLNKKATVVNKTRIVDSELFLTANFLHIL